jgi:molybdopterin-binding protein
VPLSTRNQLNGTVKSVATETLMAKVIVDVGGQEVVAVITRDSVEQLGLAEGDAVTVLVNETEVMIGK